MKKLRGLDKYLIFSYGILILYTICEMTLSTIYGIHHDTLTQALFLCFGGETLYCAVIKVFKLRSKEDMNNGISETGEGVCGDDSADNTSGS